MGAKQKKWFSARHVLFLITSVLFLSSFVSLFAYTEPVYAVTKDECYAKFDNKSYRYPDLSIADQTLVNQCRSAGFCLVKSTDEALGTVTLSCANPATLPGGTATTAADAEVKPLIQLVCGSPPASETLMDNYLSCAANVRATYASCDNTGGSITSTMQDTDANTAKCILGKLSNPKPSIADILSAVTSGRADADNVVDTAITEAEKTKCEARIKNGEKVEWDGSACVEATDSTGTCGVANIGWIICPVMTFLSGIMGDIFTFLSQHFLSTNPSLVKADPANGTFVAWGVFRNFANIAFIFAFLTIVYSQITGAGISNYGLKRMLPRLMVAALMVNLSFYICQAAIDLSNLLGYGASSIFNGIAQSATSTDSPAPSWTVYTAGALAVGAAAIGLAILVSIIIPALLAALMIILILTAREALIVLLVVVSPLAFVAYLLPNTEKFFKQWMGMFWKLLLVFPIIAMVFGVSKLTSSILYSIGLKSGDQGLMVAALGVTVIPFFVVPGLLKGAVAATGALGAKLQGYGDKATGRVGSAARSGTAAKALKSAWDYRQVSKQNKRLDKLTGNKYGKKILGKVGGGEYSSRLASRGAARDAKDHSEAVEAATAGLSGKTDKDILAQAKNEDLTDAEREAAAMHIMTKGSHAEKKQIIESSNTFKKPGTREKIADSYARSDMPSVYGKKLAEKIRFSKEPINMQSELIGNAGAISAATVAGSTNYATDVAEAYKSTSNEDVKGQLERVVSSIENTPTSMGSVVDDTTVQLRKIKSDFNNPDKGPSSTTAGPSGSSGSSGSSGPTPTPTPIPAGSYGPTGSAPAPMPAPTKPSNQSYSAPTPGPAPIPAGSYGPTGSAPAPMPAPNPTKPSGASGSASTPAPAPTPAGSYGRMGPAPTPAPTKPSGSASTPAPAPNPTPAGSYGRMDSTPAPLSTPTKPSSLPYSAPAPLPPDVGIDVDHDNTQPGTPAGPRGGSFDSSGRYTPRGATDDYHDRMGH